MRYQGARLGIGSGRFCRNSVLEVAATLQLFTRNRQQRQVAVDRFRGIRISADQCQTLMPSTMASAADSMMMYSRPIPR